MQIYKYFTPLVKHNIILLIFYFCNTGSINDGCTNAVATAMTPSIDTTTRRSPLIRMKIPSTPEKTPPTIRTRSPPRRETIVISTRHRYKAVHLSVGND